VKEFGKLRGKFFKTLKKMLTPPVVVFKLVKKKEKALFAWFPIGTPQIPP